MRATPLLLTLLIVLASPAPSAAQGAYYLGPRLPGSESVVIQRYPELLTKDEQYCVFSHVNRGPAQRYYIRPDDWFRKDEVLRTADTWLLPGEHSLALSFSGFRGAIILRFRASAGDTLISRCAWSVVGRELRAFAELTDHRTGACVASSARESPCGNPAAAINNQGFAIFLPDTAGELRPLIGDSAVRPLLYVRDRRHPRYVREQLSESRLGQFARDPQTLQYVKAYANALDIAIVDSAGRPLPGQGFRLATYRNYAHGGPRPNAEWTDATAYVDEGGVLVTERAKLYAVPDDSILVDLAPSAREQGSVLHGLAEEIRLAIKATGAKRIDAPILFFPTLGARLVAVLQVSGGTGRQIIQVGPRER